jgi:D-alanyl-D-alanine carboxypeptidase/D-alanyl-D-alanine-endopeptidase (penicillin-binding protein 4)
VIDPATQVILYQRDYKRPTAPASTLKILTSLTALTALGADTRLRTRVLRDGGGVVLVGAGDATMTRHSGIVDGAPTASLDSLAKVTAAALKKEGANTTHVSFDDSLFSGPALSHGWSPGLVAAGEISPVMALSANQGRVGAGAEARSADPALAAARYFASALEADGITVNGQATRAKAVANAPEIAGATSPTIAEMVEYALTTSDNDVAESLAHLAGFKLFGSGSFEGGVAATQKVLTDYSIPTEGLKISDGSGLSKADRVEAQTLARAVEAVVADAAPAQLAVTSPVGWAVSTGMPVAGFTGTLADRYDTNKTKAGRGVVRAKTGTLTGVVSLAGFVRDSEGRVLVFALLASGVPDIATGRLYADQFAAALATCGCHG